ncbi:MAG: hypothetical protein ACLF0P_16430 [Thermoanaerobaculia bacterium]
MIAIGVQVGQRSEPSALCVVEVQNRTGPPGSEAHFLVRHLERIPMGTTYPAVADRSAQVAARLLDRGAVRPDLYLDATGLGEPVVDLFSARVQNAKIVAVYFTQGDRRSRISHRELHLGKAYLVTRLQTLLQVGCLHLPRTPDAEGLAHDLLEFQIDIAEHANDRYDAFRVGPRDEC